jgi:hypothetical protein
MTGNAWSNRLKTEYRERRGSDLEADAAQKLSVPNAMQVDFNDNKSVEESTKYLDVLLVADKKFLQARNDTDYEQYLFTAMNMVKRHSLLPLNTYS